MTRLPPSHVRRPRLSARLRDADVGVVIGGGGYGKSRLAAELSELLGVPTITVVLEHAGSSAAMAMSRLRSAVAALGLSDATARIDRAAPDDPLGQFVGLVTAMTGQPVLVVFDEIHFADPSCATLIADAALALGEANKMLVVGRNLPTQLEALAASPRSVVIGITDLAVTAQELAEIARVGSGVELAAHQALELLTATGGWLAAVALVLSDTSGTHHAQVAADSTTISALVDQILDRLDQDQREALVQAAHLPVLDDQAVTEATGVQNLLAACRAAGLPMTDGPRRSVELIGPVRDHLRERAPATTATVDNAARDLVARAEFATAAQFLIDHGDSLAAAQVLAGLTPTQAESIDLATFASLADQLSDVALAGNPRVLLHLARVCEVGAVTRLRAEVLARAQRLVEGSSRPETVRELTAELARDLVWNERIDAADEIAKAALAETRLDEPDTRARLLDVLGRVAAMQRDDLHLAQADERFQMAAHIYRDRGHMVWLAQLQGIVAIWVHAARGAYDEALRSLDDALTSVPHQRSLRALILTFRGELLDHIGRHDEAMDSTMETEVIAAATGDRRLVAYVGWNRARQAALLGDAVALREALTQVEANRTDWFDQSGCMYLSDAADFCDLTGLIAESKRYADQARAHQVPDRPALDRMEATLAARHGDPEVAHRALQRLQAQPWFEPRDRWHVTLLRAHVAARRGDADAAARLAAEAMDEAVRLGHPQLPFVHEREICEELIALAADIGRPLAAGTDQHSFPVTVGLLGGFRVIRAGKRLEVAAGQGRQLVKLVALSGGAILAEQAIEHLWPEADPLAGANRLRTVLNRLRDIVPDLVVRVEASLQFGASVRTDVSRFEHNAGRAQSLAAVRSPDALALARAALAIYRGDLLPEDQFEPWTAVPRERMRRHAVSLLDLCQRAAADIGDVDEAVRCLDRACELEPYEEERYLAAARLLLAQGRRGAARTYLERARHVLAELGVEPPPTLLRLERSVSRTEPRR